MRRVLLVGILLIGATGIAGWWIAGEHTPPTVEFLHPAERVGRQATFDFVARAFGYPGLRTVEVRLLSGGKAHLLSHESIDGGGWLTGGVKERALHVDADLVSLGVGEGPAQLQYTVETAAWHLWGPREHVFERAVTVDLTPPTVELLTTQHHIRLGGASAAVFRVSPDTTRAGIAVGDYFFPATPGFFADPNARVTMFAVPQDLSAAVRPQIVATDGVGNTRTVALPCQIKGRSFPERPLNIDDDFLERKVPEIAAANQLPESPDRLKGFLFINGEFRRQLEKQLRDMTARSAPQPFWTGAFHRQSNAASMSAFADRRVYLHDGQVIDRQTHLGYDLASLQGAVVEAAQDGVVVFAGNFGIYGNAVLIDHGLGVFSLYGHLRAVTVSAGQRVHTAEALGQTGTTGLAGGDHLHFSVMIHGVHVDPIEWWDGHWIKDNITAALAVLPAAAEPARNENTPQTE